MFTIRQRNFRTGVELYEFRGDTALAAEDPAEDFSLHLKFIIFDDDTVFLGSLDLDPRSLPTAGQDRLATVPK